MKMRLKNTGAKILILVFAALLSACANIKPVKPPAHVTLSECARIADRSERARCIDSATRYGEGQNP